MPDWCSKTTILGVGLLGGSMALALREWAGCRNIAGYGRTEANLKEALARGIVDSYSITPSEAVRDADLVVLATPAGSFGALMREISGALKPGATVIDLGSVKTAVIPEVEASLPDGAFYVPCHPIAGGESSGIGDARMNLFEGALAIITPTAHTDPDHIGMIEALWITIGARPMRLTPEDHDSIYALVSHLPHLAAYALVHTVGDVSREAMEFAGNGFRDTTRIASSQARLWREICLMNRTNVLEALGAFKANIERVEGLLREADGDGLENYFGRARELRKSLCR